MAQALLANDDSTYTIALFTDIHWRNGDAADQRSAALMDAVLDAEQPDLVVFNGDTIHGGACADPAASLRAALAPVTSRDLPWVAVFGNHDDEGTLDRAALMQVMTALPGCRAEPGPEALAGVGNYVRTVVSTTGRAMAHLYFLDSHSYAQTGIGGYDWIKRDQIAWYLATASKLNATHGEDVPALFFCHIPLSEYNEVWDLHTCYGHKGEPICCPLVNSGMFACAPRERQHARRLRGPRSRQRLRRHALRHPAHFRPRHRVRRLRARRLRPRRAAHSSGRRRGRLHHVAASGGRRARHGAGASRSGG
ncbi:MAG: metallophosphoesterase family protein [Caldilineaceae bacterium]